MHFERRRRKASPSSNRLAPPGSKCIGQARLRPAVDVVAVPPRVRPRPTYSYANITAGRAIDFDIDGVLIVLDDHGRRHTIRAGDVTLL